MHAALHHNVQKSEPEFINTALYLLFEQHKRSMLPSNVLLFFSLLGLISITNFIISLLHYFYAFFLRPAIDLKSHYGSWALVTGPTDGIGKSIAFELARKNLNLILVGRNPDKLNNISTSIKQKYPTVDIKTVVMDLAGDLRDGMQRLREVVKGLEVGVVVNNAGVSSLHAMYFHETKMEDSMEIVQVNLVAVTEISREVVKGMVDRGRGAIVNIGSGASVVVPSFPFFAVYAATKAYVNQLSKSLHVEYKNQGIDVQCHVPLYVDTKMTSEKLKEHSHSFLMASPDAYAHSVVRWIGRDAQCLPYFPHFIMWCCTRLIPDFILDPAIRRSNINKGRPRSLL